MYLAQVLRFVTQISLVPDRLDIAIAIAISVYSFALLSLVTKAENSFALSLSPCCCSLHYDCHVRKAIVQFSVLSLSSSDVSVLLCV